MGERMGLRDPFRNSYPPHFAFDPAYAAAAANFTMPPPAQKQAGTAAYPFPSYDGPADPFAAHRTSNGHAAFSRTAHAVAGGKGHLQHRPTLDDHLSGGSHGHHHGNSNSNTASLSTAGQARPAAWRSSATHNTGPRPLPPYYTSV